MDSNRKHAKNSGTLQQRLGRFALQVCCHGVGVGRLIHILDLLLTGQPDLDELFLLVAARTEDNTRFYKMYRDSSIYIYIYILRV